MKRPRPPLCPEAAYRASLADGEFWDYVLNGRRPDDGDDDFGCDEPPVGPEYPTPCAECGAVGACAYDIDGRPLIHVTVHEA